MATFNMWATEEGMLEYSLNVTDIVDLTMSHIHVGNASASGPVAVVLLPVSGRAAERMPCTVLTVWLCCRTCVTSLLDFKFRPAFQAHPLAAAD